MFSGVTFAGLASTVRNEPSWVGEVWEELGTWCMSIPRGSVGQYLHQGPRQGSIRRPGDGEQLGRGPLSP